MLPDRGGSCRVRDQAPRLLLRLQLRRVYAIDAAVEQGVERCSPCHPAAHPRNRHSSSGFCNKRV